MSAPTLAVIVPAFNEADRIFPTLGRMEEYLSQTSYDWRVVVVSDGSSDQTPAKVGEFCTNHRRFTLDHYTPNRGKGFAVRRGVLNAQTDLILFSDADLATPIEEIEKLQAAIDKGAKVAIGSRPLKDSDLKVRQPLYREVAGRLFNLAVQTLAVNGIKDTQCGFKLFPREVAYDIFRRSKVDRFGFDFEVLMIAHDLGYAIAEVPVVWRHQEGSKVNLLRDGTEMLQHLVKLRLMGKEKRLALNPEIADKLLGEPPIAN